MSLAKRFTAGSGDYGWNLLAAAATQGSTFLTALVLTHVLRVEAFGRYVVGQTTVVALGSLFGLGLGFVANARLARHAPDDPIRAASIHRFCLTVASISGVIAAVVVCGGSGWLAEHLFHNAVQREILVAGIALPFAVIFNYQTGALAGLAAFRELAGVAVAGAVTLLAGAALGAVVGGSSGALVGLILSLVVRCWLSNRVLRLRGSSFLDSPDIGFRSTWYELRSFVLPAFFSGLTAMSAIWLSNAILTSHTDTRSLGIFSSAFLIKALVTFVPLQFGSVLLSRLSSLSAKGDVSAWNRTHLIVLLAGVGSAVALAGPIALGATYVMGMFGPEFREGAELLRWLMLCAVVESAATLTYYGFPARGQFWQAALVYSVPKDLVLLGSALLFASQYGSQGLAWAHTASWTYGLLALFALLAINRRLKVDEHSVVPQ